MSLQSKQQRTIRVVQGFIDTKKRREIEPRNEPK